MCFSTSRTDMISHKGIQLISLISEKCFFFPPKINVRYFSFFKQRLCLDFFFEYYFLRSVDYMYFDSRNGSVILVFLIFKQISNRH